MLHEAAYINMDSPVNAQKARAAVAPAAAPDGGYAWFVLLSCFLVFGLTFGVIKAFGVFYVEIHQYFETTATGTSWITSIAVATIHIVGNHNLIKHRRLEVFTTRWLYILKDCSTLEDVRN